MSVAQRRELTRVARGEAPATSSCAVALCSTSTRASSTPPTWRVLGERIAYVGAREDMVGSRTRVLDVGGRVLVPGYIDPHVHPAHLVTPSALARHLLALGTTSVFADTLQIWELGGLPGFRAAPTRWPARR